MIKAGIIGATGYAGGELVRLLLGHKNVEIKWYGSKSYIDKKYAEVYQNMFQLTDEICMRMYTRTCFRLWRIPAWMTISVSWPVRWM